MDNPSDRFAPLSDDERAEGLQQNSQLHSACEAKALCPPPNAESGEEAATRLSGGHPNYLWRYVMPDGATAFCVCRWQQADGTKTVRPLSWVDGEGWKFAAWPDMRPLYRLDDITKKPQAPIVICEGEKAANAAASVFPQTIVTTSSGGAHAAKKTDWTPLAGRSVLIWPDNDEPGQKYADEVAAILAPLACAVSVVDVAALAAHNPEGGERTAQEKWDAADAVAEWSDLNALRDAAVKLAKVFEPAPAYVSFGPFEMTAEGLTVKVEKGHSPNKTTEIVCVSSPFEILGACRDPKGHGWGKWLRWRDGDDRQHVRHIEDAALQGDPSSLCQTLADEGLKINRNAQRQLAEYLSRAQVDGRVTIVHRTGWHVVDGKSVFVLSEETIRPCSTETVILDTATNGLYERRGSLREWQESVAKLASDHTLPTLAISAAFVGPLLALANEEGGGIHFCGQSSRGKTTLLRMAASVWGPPDRFVRTWRATANGLEGAAACASDTTLILDEFGQIDPRDAAAALYSLANGIAKQRATRDGSLREPRNWRVMFISSGELPTEAKLAEDRGRRARAGQIVRLLDIPAERAFGVFDHAGNRGDAAALAKVCTKAACAAYGTAGAEFVEHLISRDVTGEEIHRFISAFVAKHAPPSCDGQVIRAAQRFGLIATAGELATAFGVTPWEEGAALAAAAWAFKRWIADSDVSESIEARKAIAQVRLAIEQHGESRFQSLDHPDSKPVNNRLGWRKGSEYWIPPEIWRTDICNGLDSQFVARTLAERGMLRRQNGNSLQCAVNIGGAKRVRAYVLTAAIIEEGKDD